MDISNKTLGLLLVAAIVVSVGGTFFSLDKINGFSTTGYASQSGLGDVNLSINSTVSIVMFDNIIDFGTCNLVTTPMTFDSSLDDTDAHLSNCSLSGSFPDHLTVENDGNSFANVTVAVNAIPATVYNDPGASAALAFQTVGTSGRSGCSASDDQAWTTMAAATSENACANLTYVDTADRFDLDVRVTLENTATTKGSDSMRFTFTASALA